MNITVFETAEAFQESLSSAKPNCAIVDVRLPDRSGLRLQQDLLADGIEVPLIFLSGDADIQAAVCAMKDGAVNFLSKSCRDQDLIDAIHEGIERDRGRRAHQAAAAEIRANYKKLTSREHEVMRLLATGYPVEEIAALLRVSPNTAKNYRRSVLEKMNARSLVAIVHDALTLGVITIPDGRRR